MMGQGSGIKFTRACDAALPATNHGHLVIATAVRSAESQAIVRYRHRARDAALNASHVSNPSPEARPDVREGDAMRRDAMRCRRQSGNEKSRGCASFGDLQSGWLGIY